MHRTLKFFATAATVLCLCSPALADPGDCGTIALPVGGGDGPSADITSFSPIFADTAYNATVSLLLYPNLLWINRFSNIDWSRSLAKAVDTTDDQTFTITMRPWNWSDGVPVTSSDVVYAFSLIKKLGPTWPGYGGGGLPDIVKSITATDPAHVQIVLTHKVNPQWFMFNGISGLGPLPEHAWKQYSTDQMFQLQSTPSFFNVVDGPLKLKSFVVGQDAVFVPNPAWQGQKMHFNRLVFSFLQGDGPAIMAARSGDVDAAELPNDLYDVVAKLPGFHVEILQQSVYQNVMNLNFQNPHVAFFHDVNVREAMDDSINQQQIITTAEHGHGDPAYGPVPVSMTAFLSPDMKKGIYPVGYNPKKARELLLSDGWKPGADGIMVKDGKRLSFTYLMETGTNSTLEIDEMIQQMLRKTGIEMKFKLMDFNQMIEVMSTQPQGWDATGTGASVGFYPTGEEMFETGAFQNMGGYSDPEMDKLIKATTDKDGIENMYAFETYVSAQQPVIYSPRTRPVILVSNRLHGMSGFINPVGNMAPDQLYCSAESAK